MSPNPSCTTIAVDYVIRHAAGAVLSYASSILGVRSPGRQNYPVTLKVPACMRFDSGDSTYKNCEPSTECCTKHSINLRIINGCPTVTGTGFPTTGNCANPVGGCVNSCDDLDFPLDTCLIPRTLPCGWACSFLDEDTCHKDFPGGGDVEGHFHYSMRDDTLCVEMEHIYYSYTTNPNDEEAIRRVVGRILYKMYDEQWGNDPGPHYIRLTIPSCYRRYSNNNRVTLWPCYEFCCSKLYILTRSGNVITSYLVPSGSSPDPECPPLPNSCSVPACTSSIYNTQPLPKSPLQEEVIHPNDRLTTYVKPNPTNEAINIYLIGGVNGAFTLEVFDARSNKVLEKAISKENYEETVPISIKQFASGIYTYRITDAFSVVSSGKFVVIK